VYLKTLKEANFAEFLFHARKFTAGVPVARQGKVTQQGAKRG